MTLYCLPELEHRWNERGEHIFPYQIETAETVIEKMGGRAILADEVGLGKTIEAGIIVRELMVRHGAKSLLVLTPAALVQQWHEEMLEKFDLRLEVPNENPDWHKRDRLCVSIDTAKRKPQCDALHQRTWDIIIVDEAHRLKNARSVSHGFVRNLSARYILLLSATPLQNDLHELYNLVSIVRPDLFGSFNRFQREFAITKRLCKNAEQLKEILSQVMIRNKRSEISVSFPPRDVTLQPVMLNAAEKRLYDDVTCLLRDEYWNRLRTNSIMLPLLTLQKEVCSSPAALLASLERMDTQWMGEAAERLRQKARAITTYSKASTLLQLLEEIDEKVIVFTEYRATQQYFAQLLKQNGIRVVQYHGALKGCERAEVISEFRDSARVLLSTESGGQGLNLQHCRTIVNVDLPWNPMRIEQRIGRVHRIGQTQPVIIYNLYARNTIEEHILRLLDEKINLFRQVIGELDTIIRHFEHRRSLETRIFEIALTSSTPEEIDDRMNKLGEQLLAIRRKVDQNLVWSTYDA